VNWRPTASLAALRRRAELLATVRGHFAAQGVLEVETPLLGDAGAGDPAIASVAVVCGGRRRWLQTSPESAMKRLLAAGSGDIYQLCKAFRDEPAGPLHRTEFTILEWYRLGFDHHRLMDDVAALVGRVLPGLCLAREPYAGLSARCGAPDPFRAPTEQLADWARARGLTLTDADANDRTLLLDFLLSEVVREAWTNGRGGFVYDFPPEQAAYATLRDEDPPVASRFELVIDGVEIANGWQELTDPLAQRARHAAEAAARTAHGLPLQSPDPRLLAAFDAGLPPCAGVALGIDRLAMLATGARDLAAVLACGDDETVRDS
jgi:lysyl-tRNA synthetase class 2